MTNGRTDILFSFKISTLLKIETLGQSGKAFCCLETKQRKKEKKKKGGKEYFPVFQSENNLPYPSDKSHNSKPNLIISKQLSA